MNNITLQLAADTAKMIILLGKGILTSSQHSQLRSRVDESVYTLVRLGQLKASNSEKLEMELGLKNMHDTLVKEMRFLSVDAIVEKKEKYSLMAVLSNGAMSVPQARGIFERLLGLPTIYNTDFEKIKKINKSGDEALIRGKILRAFASIVRNDEWLSLMLTLNAVRPVLLNTVLVEEYSSRQGLNERIIRFNSLLSEKKSVSSSLVETPAILVGLTTKFVAQHARVTPIWSSLMVDVKNGAAVNKLFDEATKLEEINPNEVTGFIKKRLDALVKGLTLQKKIHERETLANRAAAERVREDAAVSALSGMGAHLAVLASNPALLARALEAAGLAPGKVVAKKVASKKVAVKNLTTRVNARKKV